MSTQDIILAGVPGTLVVIGIVALVEQAFPAVGKYAGLLAIAIATVVGTLALYLAGGPIQNDVLEALGWGLASVAVHGTVVQPLKQ